MPQTWCSSACPRVLPGRPCRQTGQTPPLNGNASVGSQTHQSLVFAHTLYNLRRKNSFFSHSLFLIYCCPLFPTSMQSLLYLQMLFIRVQIHFIVQVCSNILQRMDFGKAIWMDVQHLFKGLQAQWSEQTNMFI